MENIKEPGPKSELELVSVIREEAREQLYSCLDFLHRAISIESYSGKEEQMAQLLVGFFQENSIPVFVDPRGSVIALLTPDSLLRQNPPPKKKKARIWSNWVQKMIELGKKENLATMAFNAHMDVVAVGDTFDWRYHPFHPTRDRGVIYGRGTCDMKGALACMAQAMVIGKKLQNRRPLQRMVLGCFVTEEEVSEGLAFKEIIHDGGMRPDMVILGEPSKLDIARGQRGKLEMKLVGRGRKGHSSVPEFASNAAYKLARAILAVENFDKREYARIGSDPFRVLERSTMVVTSVQTEPHATSSVPDLAEATVTVRLAEGQNFSTISSALGKLLEKPEVEFELLSYRGASYTGRRVTWPSEHLAWQLPVDHPFFRFLQECCKKVFGKERRSKIWPFSTDGVFSAGVEKIPTLGIGPGREEVAHTVDEHIPISDIEEALALYSYLPFSNDFSSSTEMKNPQQVLED